MNKCIRVVVVDDSAFSRRTITKMLNGFDGIRVTGYAATGEEAIRKVGALKPDLVTVDLDMPVMDGFTLLRILTTRFSTPVIVISALNGADAMDRALKLGALDFVAKPSRMASERLLSIRDELCAKVLRAMRMPPGGCDRNMVTDSIGPRPSEHSWLEQPHFIGDQRLFDIIAIGASTGGPPALQSIFSSFEKPLPCPVVVSQHMPPGFTTAFAERLNRSSVCEVKEAMDGDEVLPGRILIAPGGVNLLFERSSGGVIARTTPPTPDNRYSPSIDVMFSSCARIFGSRMLAVILTGMGNDGSQGVRAVKKQGGFVMAESDETAVVYGMPREAVATGLVDRIIPLHHMAHEILFRGSFI